MISNDVDPFADGLYAEAGAVDFCDAYILLIRHIRLFDLPVVEVPHASTKQVVYAGGNRYRPPATSPASELCGPARLRMQRATGLAGKRERFRIAHLLASCVDTASLDLTVYAVLGR